MRIRLKTIKRKRKIQEMIGTTSSKGYHIIEAKQDTDIILKHMEENVNNRNDIYENRAQLV